MCVCVIIICRGIQVVHKSCRLDYYAYTYLLLYYIGNGFECVFDPVEINLEKNK